MKVIEEKLSKNETLRRECIDFALREMEAGGHVEPDVVGAAISRADGYYYYIVTGNMPPRYENGRYLWETILPPQSQPQDSEALVN